MFLNDVNASENIVCYIAQWVNFNGRADFSARSLKFQRQGNRHALKSCGQNGESGKSCWKKVGPFDFKLLVVPQLKF